MISVEQIQSLIQSNEKISFWYCYSHPDVDRLVEPISISKDTLIARENGSIKRFKIDGITLI